MKIKYPAIASMLLAASAAHGALISVGTQAIPTTVDATVINPLPIVVAAWDVNSNAASQVLNGVTFSNTIPPAFTVSSGLTSATVVDAALTESRYPAGSALREIMGDLIATAQTTGTGIFTANGLTVGETYRIEFLAHQDINSSTLRNMQIHFGSDATGTGTGFFSVGQTTGQIATFDFTADAITQDFFFRSSGVTNARAVLNGVVLSVPEPSAALLGGLGLLVLLRRRR
jgi:hypothetical protein